MVAAGDPTSLAKRDGGLGVWTWTGAERRAVEDFGFEAGSDTGAFTGWLFEAASGDSLTAGHPAYRDLVHRLDFSSTLLRLPETGEQLAERFLDVGFLGRYLDGRRHAMRSREEDA